jgi:hypothetical protein|tara:strand:- start:416 stop:2362 length:1947 start_codon:yes stop_codon:yes gene_type:complete
MPLVQTRGAASAQGFGEFARATAVNYIEDVFSTWLYTGNSSTQTITNNIDLSTKGGLVWIKMRSAGYYPKLYDTSRGVNKSLNTTTTDAETLETDGITAFNSSGFTMSNSTYINNSGSTFVSWTFREQPKFFDVVTYTGDGVNNRDINHSLNGTVGMIIIKRTDSFSNWRTYHITQSGNLNLNTTAAVGLGGQATITNVTSTKFTVSPTGTDDSVNTSSATYVAYIFAHDAGGFGLTGTDNVISCGSFTGNTTVNLGFEPQWVMFKQTNGTGGWFINDNMRNWRADNSTTGTGTLRANSPDAENTGGADWNITSTGFSTQSIGAGSFIYIAIRRGPMKVPTLGTSVFAPNARVGTGAASAEVTNISFPPDMSLTKVLNANNKAVWFDRLRGPLLALVPSDTQGAQSIAGTLLSFNMNGISIGNTGESTYDMNYTKNYVDWFFRRAPGFFDEVCYAGQNSAPLTNSHNLGVTPELAIIKNRTTGTDWLVQTQITGLGNYLNLNTIYALSSAAYFITAWTSTTFTLSNGITATNTLGSNYVAYLFATCPGVSKVGSYTGNGTTQTINCGFTGGARFVLIKRTDNTGDWYVWDSARGIVAGNDPHLSLNAADAEVTTDDSVDTDNSGFIVNQLSATNINVTSATYIFLSVA